MFWIIQKLFFFVRPHTNKPLFVLDLILIKATLTLLSTIIKFIENTDLTLIYEIDENVFVSQLIKAIDKEEEKVMFYFHSKYCSWRNEQKIPTSLSFKISYFKLIWKRFIETNTNLYIFVFELFFTWNFFKIDHANAFDKTILQNFNMFLRIY